MARAKKLRIFDAREGERCGMKHSAIGIASGLCLLAASAAGAATLEYTSYVPMARTNWSTTVNLPKFDPSLGTLGAVNLAIVGHVEGDAAFQNLNASAATVTTTISARIELHPTPDTLLVAATPHIVKVDTVAGFTGDFSFDGPDARRYSDLVAAESFSRDVPVLDLSQFIGAGTIAIPVNSAALSSVRGPGNLIVQFSTRAAADVTVTYDYIAVPEPISIGLFGAALASLALRRR